MITLARNNNKKVTYSTHYEQWVDGERIERTEHRSYSIGSEADYVKIYHTGLLYMRDMPPDCMRLLVYLLPYVRYAEPLDSYMFNYSLTVTIDPMLKREIADALGYKNITSVSNLLTELIDGGVLHRVGKGLYRLNPHLFGRGNVKDMGEIRAISRPPVPGATFMSVYNDTKKQKQRKKDGQESQQIDDEDDIGPMLL